MFVEIVVQLFVQHTSIRVGLDEFDVARHRECVRSLYLHGEKSICELLPGLVGGCAKEARRRGLEGLHVLEESRN